jgi:hypothetical protein
LYPRTASSITDSLFNHEFEDLSGGVDHHFAPANLPTTRLFFFLAALLRNETNTTSPHQGCGLQAGCLFLLVPRFEPKFVDVKLPYGFDRTRKLQTFPIVFWSD